MDGEIVFFHVRDNSSATALTYSPIKTKDKRLGSLLSVLITMLAIVLGWKNVHAGRSDLRGALRLAFFIFVVNLAEFILGSVLAPGVLLTGLLLALAAATRVWIYYVALEPLARRYWPEMLVTWSRALSGRVQDPVIGRDILYGTTIGILFTLVAFGLLGIPPDTNPSSLCGTRFLFAQLARGLEYALRFSLYLAMMMVLVRSIVGNKWLPVIAGACMVFAWQPPGLFDPLWNVAIAVYEKEWTNIRLEVNGLATIVGYSGYYAVVATLLARWGILAASSFLLCHDFFRNYPWSADFFGPDLPGCVFAIAGIVLCALYGFYVSLGGRAAFVSR